MNKLGQFAAACAAVLCGFGAFGAQAEAEVPAKFVEYIESSGVEYIDLGEVLTSNTVATVDFVPMRNLSGETIFGKRQTFAFITHDWIYVLGKRIVTEAYQQDTTQHSVITIDVPQRKIFANGSELALGAYNGSENGASSAQAYLFWARSDSVATGAESKAKLRVYSCVISNDNQLAVNLYPCVDKNGVAGFYDTVSRRILRNAGDGALKASDVECPWPAELRENLLEISAAPAELAAGSVIPTYGVYPYLEDGSNIVCTAPATWTSPSGGLSLTCTGYKRYSYDAAGDSWTYLDSGTGATYSYTHEDGAAIKLEWQFDVVRTHVQLKPGDDIVAAVATASDGDVFELAAGTYELTAPLVLSAACTVKGAGMDETILKQTVSNTRVVEMRHAGAVLQDCQVTGSNWTREEWHGITLYIPEDGGGTVTNCHICGNRTNANQNKGVGFDCESPDGLITHSIVNDNKVTGGTNNSQGGMRLGRGRADHCLVYDNVGRQAGGICLEGPALVTYCTIVANSVSSSNSSSTGGGVCAQKGYNNPDGTGGGAFENCVIWGNSCPDSYTGDGRPEVWVESGLDLTFRNCAFPKDLKLPSRASDTGSMFVDVVFTDFANGDYTQKPSSPARNLGYYTPYVEPKELNCECAADKTALLTGDGIALTSFVSGVDDTDTITYAWEVTRAGGATETLTEANPVYRPAAPGDYSATLTVTRNGTESKTADGTLRFTAFDATTKVPTVAALVKALSNLCDGVTLELEEDTYELTTPVVLSAGSTIVGRGIDRTILRQTVANKRIVELRHPDAVIRGCTITGAVVTEEIGVAAAVYIPTIGGGTIDHCRVTGNSCSRNQDKCVGIDCESASGVISYCIVDNNKVTGNSNETQGGIRLTAGTVDHCLVYKNVGHQTGGICLDGPATVTYCTVVDNAVANPSHDGWFGGGMAVRKAGARVENTIIYGNTCPDIYSGVGKPEIRCTAAATFVNCAFPTTITLPDGVQGTPFQAEVKFTDFANGDYTQKISSPARDIGYYTPYESGDVFACECTGTKTALLLGATVEFAAFAAGVREGDTVTYAWTVTRPDQTTEVLTGANVSYAPAQAGDYAVALSATKNGTETVEAEAGLAFTAYAAPTAISTVAELEKAADNPCEGLVLELAADTFVLTRRLDVTVGYTIRGAGRDQTVLRAGFTGTQVVKIDHAGARLENLTVTGGNINKTESLHGAGLQIGTFGGTASGCRITGNQINKNQTHGAGVALLGANALLDRCIVDGNSMPTALNHHGGGVYITAGMMDNCLVCSNSLTNGGSGYSYRGGGVYVGGSCTIRNCTIAGNTAVDGGGGIALADNSTVKTCTLYNTIIAGNATLATRDTSVGAPEWIVGSNSKIVAQACLMPEGTGTNAVTGAGWMLADPRFRNAAAGNYRIRSDSSAVDAGVSYDGMSATDVYGRPRVRKYGVDIGACENQAEGLVIFVR